jgi:hypothetical protein
MTSEHDQGSAQAVTSAAVDILDAGDALVTALGAYLDGDIGPRVEAQGMEALERWHQASAAFLSIVDRELGER